MTANEIKKIACVGSGVIGTSWALGYAMAGLDVVIYDVADGPIAAAKETMKNNVEFLLKKNIISDADSIYAHVSYTTDMAEAVKDVQFIQESGPENYGIKETILANIEANTAEDTIIASSTSGLLITEMAKKMKNPERLVGGHPYNPPHLIPLVEIVKGESTDDAVAKTAYEFYEKIGKEPVLVNKEVSGYISNRLQVALYREVIDLVQNGVATLEDVDKACLYGPGIRWGIMGPSMILNLGAGKLGLGEMLNRQRESFNLRLSEMADWKDMPQEFIDNADAGIAEAVAHRAADKGKTIEELVEYRDNMLLEVLKLHGKI